MFGPFWKATGAMMKMFVPGIGEVDVGSEDAPPPGAVAGVLPGTTYKSIKQIKQECSEPPRVIKPTFILSKSRIFRRRVGRILYGKEGEDLFL